MDNLISLFIIDNIGPKQLYIHNFIKTEGELDEEESIRRENIQDLFSKGLIGIDSIVSAMTDTSSKIERI